MLTINDEEALVRAMRIAMKDPVRRVQIEDMMTDESWTYAAKFAAGHLQRKALKLKPWQLPPCRASASDPASIRLRDRMIRAGLSVYEPDPISELARCKEAAE